MPGIESFLGGPWGAGLGIGSSVLSALFGGNKDPQDQYRQFMQMMQQYMNPQTIGNYTNQFYQQYLQSPSYLQSKQSLTGGANAIQQQYRQGAGAMGQGTGIGLNAQALAAGSYGSGVSNLQAQGYQNAGTQAQQLAQMLASGLRGFNPQLQQNAWSKLGNVSGPFNDFLLKYILGQQNRGGGFGGGGWNPGGGGWNPQAGGGQQPGGGAPGYWRP